MEIRLVKQCDAGVLANYYMTNTEHFRRWEPIRENGYYSEDALFYRLAEYEKQHANGSAAHFVGIDDAIVIAQCSLTNVIYGPFMACFMGYSVSQQHEGTGVMTRVCSAAIDYGFSEFGLNRIMANYMPANTRSANLLSKLGFSEEGFAKKYLKINGNWEDHVLTSLLKPKNF